VIGKVSAAINGIYGLALTDVNTPATHIFVKLESSQRSDFNPQLNPAILTQNIIVTGTRNSYMGEPGIRYVTDISIAPTALSVEQALATAQGESIELTGNVKSALNDIYALVLEDITNPSFTINVKLESAQRNQFSPQLNPEVLDAQIRVKGVRDSYMSQAGIRQVSSIEMVASNSAEPSNDLSVSEVLNMANGTTVTLAGQIKGAINGKYALELVDPDDSASNVYIKLEASQRDDFSPQLNPALIGKRLRVEGMINDYMSHAGIKNVTKLTRLD
ncbi:MAG: hypothetical protein ACI9LG_001776, partial [Moritella dasanensis]